MGVLQVVRGWFRRDETMPRMPGDVIDQDYLEPAGLDDAEFAAILDVSENDMIDILLGSRPIDAEIAAKLGKVCKRTDANYWLVLQKQYDDWRASVMNKETNQ